MYDVRDYCREGDDLTAAFGRLQRAMMDDIKAEQDKAREKAELKTEIIAELKPYIDNCFAIKFENAASPAIKDLKAQIDSLFKP